MRVYIHTPLDFVPCAFLLIERYIWREMHFILSPDFFLQCISDVSYVISCRCLPSFQYLWEMNPKRKLQKGLKVLCGIAQALEESGDRDGGQGLLGRE